MSASPLSSIPDAGIFYAEKYGFRILTVQERGKRPVLDNWPETASNDPDIVKRMLAAHRGNIGVACGPGSNLVVIDVDLPDGELTLVELERELGPLPSTLEQRTGSGGRQLFFRYPEGKRIRNSAGKNGKGLGVNVDIRAEGGQVVVPPSVHPNGNKYAWASKGLPPADLPAAWVARMEEKPHRRHSIPSQTNARHNAASGELPPYAKAAIDSELELLATAPQGERNHSLNRSAFALGQWVGGGYLSEGEAERLLVEAATRCGLVADDGERQVGKTISSGLTSGKMEPRHVPDPSPRASHAPADDGTNGTNVTNDALEDEQESRILPPPPPVPLEAFPAEVAAMLEEAAEAFTVPLQIPATCLLGVLSCLVGGTRMISLRPSWKEPGNIWIATVAASGIGKTPCATAFFRPVKDLEYAAFKAWQEEYTDYETELEFFRKERKRAKRGDNLAEKPVQPSRRQAYIDDATVEALGEVLSENQRGIMWRKDELAGLIADLDKYSSGNSGGGTRSRLLSSYDGQEWKTSRTSNPTRNLYIPHAYVGIFGGIQPAMLPKVFEAGSAGVDEASGFLQRFMLIRAEREKPGYWTERYLSQGSKELLASIAAALWSWDIEYDAEGREVEKVVPVSRQAKTVFIGWFNGIAQEEFLSQNAALLSKLKGQAQRICLLLHCLDAALTGNDGMGIVTEDTMRRALLLADWVKEHQEQCWRFFTPEKGAKQADPIERAIMAVVVENAARIEADGWKISNADLCSLVEAKLNMPGLSKEKIGKAASGLELTPCLIGERRLRGRLVTREKIDTFKTPVSPVSPVSLRSAPKVSGRDSTVSEPSRNRLAPLPAWAEEAEVRQCRDSSETVPSQPEHVAPQQHETGETGETGDSGYNFDFNDPDYPDEDRVEI